MYTVKNTQQVKLSLFMADTVTENKRAKNCRQVYPPRLKLNISEPILPSLEAGMGICIKNAISSREILVKKPGRRFGAISSAQKIK